MLDSNCMIMQERDQNLPVGSTRYTEYILPNIFTELSTCKASFNLALQTFYYIVNTKLSDWLKNDWEITIFLLRQPNR